MTEQTKKERIFSVSNLYLKDLSYEAPQTPFVFNQEWKPNLDFDLNMKSKALAKDFFEVTLKATVSASLEVKKEDLPEGQTDTKTVAFLIEVDYSGVFNIAGFEEQDLQHLLSVKCPEIIYPYARETISSLATRGAFPQLVLPPMNFELMYLEHLKKQQEAEKKISKTADNSETVASAAH